MESSIPKTAHSNSNLKWFIIIGILVFLLVISLTWNILTQTTGKKLFTKTSKTQITSEQSDFFDSQLTTVKGEITKIEGDRLSIKNERGKTLDAKASSPLLGPAGINSPSSPSLNFELNKLATINFQAIDGEYQVISVIYLQNSDTPQGNNIPTPSSSPPQSQPLILERPMGIPNNPTSDMDKTSDTVPSPSPKPSHLTDLPE